MNYSTFFRKTIARVAGLRMIATCEKMSNSFSFLSENYVTEGDKMNRGKAVHIKKEKTKADEASQLELSKADQKRSAQKTKQLTLARTKSGNIPTFVEME